jgi:hypothetical protein
VGADVALEVYPPQPTLRDLLAGLGQVQAGTGGLAGALDGALAATSLPDPKLAARLRVLLRTICALQSSHIWAVSPATWLLTPL